MPFQIFQKRQNKVGTIKNKTMETKKKRGRGRPKKAVSVSKPEKKNTIKVWDISTNELTEIEKPIKEELPKEKYVMHKDFSILIDNQTPEGDVRFIEEGDKELRALFLSGFYLENAEFRNFINKIITDAAREKANNLANTLHSLV